jgi:pyridoxine kinase
MAKPAVIVVNSLVARGGVGGRASVFALERLGFPVWLVPTVLLSWHPRQGPATRIVPQTAEFQPFLADLAAARWLSEVGAILTGYLGDVAQVEWVVRLIQALKACNPSALFLCDPVIGDRGRLFQPEALAMAVRDRLVPLADIVTPNRFELGWCAGAAAEGNADLVNAARRLGRPEVVVTSAFAPSGIWATSSSMEIRSISPATLPCGPYRTAREMSSPRSISPTGDRTNLLRRHSDVQCPRPSA